MKRILIGIAIGASVGLVLGIGGIALEIPPVAMLAVVVLMTLAWPTLCFGIIAPRQTHRCLVKVLDPDWRPPETAQPATSPLLDRLGALAAARDWDGLTAHYTDDFVMTDIRGNRYGKKLYVRVSKASHRVYRDYRSKEEELLADPARPDVFYRRSTDTGRPRSGPPLDMTGWSRITLAPCGERVREITADAVTRVG